MRTRGSAPINYKNTDGSMVQSVPCFLVCSEQKTRLLTVAILVDLSGDNLRKKS